MIDHLSTYATDYSTTQRFYTATLGALGYTIQMEMTTSWDPDFPERRCCAFGPPGRPSEFNDETIMTALEDNFLSSVRFAREVIPYMKQQRWGRIINLLSNAVRQPVLDLVLSTSSRLAVVGYAKMLSNELARFNITVNNVLPGQVMTDRMTSLYQAMAEKQNRSAEELMKEAAQLIPMRRLGRPEEMGDLIAFLASERASYITGQNMSLDGGALAGII